MADRRILVGKQDPVSGLIAPGQYDSGDNLVDPLGNPLPGASGALLWLGQAGYDMVVPLGTTGLTTLTWPSTANWIVFHAFQCAIMASTDQAHSTGTGVIRLEYPSAGHYQLWWTSVYVPRLFTPHGYFSVGGTDYLGDVQRCVDYSVGQYHAYQITAVNYGARQITISVGATWGGWSGSGSMTALYFT